MQAFLLCLLLLLITARAIDLDSLLNEDKVFDNWEALDITAEPTAEPSAAPTAQPSEAPTAQPSEAPTTQPSKAPTVRPSVAPTFARPTPHPSRAPTAKPSTPVPTAVPTPPGLNLVSFKVEQPIHGLDKSYYDANKAAVDTSFQQAVAATMPGVSPVDVEGLQVTFPVSRMRRLESATAIARFTIVAHIQGATYESLSSLYIAATTSGLINELIAAYAAENDISDFTVSEPKVENALQQRASSSMLTGAQITGLVIGIFMFLAVAAIVVAFVLKQRKPQSESLVHETVETQL